MVEKKNNPTITQPQPPFLVGYEIFVRSFADSNHDGIGDLPGLTAKLDYVANLGADAIWLMPVNSSPSYHGYDVTNYFDINPQYGSKQDFRVLVAEAHKRGIKVLMDLVLNHTSAQHPWFKQSVLNKKHPYRQYYSWQSRQASERHIRKENLEEDSDNPIQWHPYPLWRKRFPYTADYFYAYFWEGMPDLNYAFKPVRKKAIEIGKYWMEEFGVDGYRLDAAKHIFPDHRHADNVIWWKEFRQALEKVNPATWLLGEVWDEPEVVSPYFSGLHSLFNFHLASQIIGSVKTENAGNLVADLCEVRNFYLQTNPSFTDTIFLTNHDQDRIMSQLGNSPTKAQLAAAILFSLPGIIFLYYGEELGMTGVKPDENIRTPFPWGKADPLQTCWAPSHTSGLFQLATAQEQQEMTTSVYAYYRKLIAFRKQEAWLSHAATAEVGFTIPASVLGVSRQAPDGTKWLFLHNLSGSKQSIALPQKTSFSVGDFPLSQWKKQTGHALEMAPYASLILSEKPS